ncbi:MAG: hypothetical protein ABSG86_16755 [Thermoguttaceae bacterium]|jgi:hypothetical protein
MLAVKLHKKALPWLGSGSHLVPIVRWDAGKLQLRRWHYLLTASRTTPWPNNRVHHLTLVRIPDDLPVRFVFDYGARTNLKMGIFRSQEFRALRDWPQEVKRALQEWWDAYYARPQRRMIGSWEVVVPGGSEPGGLMSRQPELVLGKKLPDSCIKWTKDIRLLYGRQAKQRRSEKRREDG